VLEIVPEHPPGRLVLDHRRVNLNRLAAARFGQVPLA